MSDYSQLLLLMKIGFSGTLFLTGFYGLFVLIRQKRTPGVLLSLPAILAIILIAIGVLLALSDHKNQYDFLNMVKIISGIFTLVYGVYATLSDFYEEDESGRRVIRRVGLIGIILFFSSTILSISADHVKRAIEKQIVERQKKYLESIVDKIVIVDKSTGEMNINFRRFSDQLFTDIKKVNNELQLSREELGSCEGKRGELEKELGTARNENVVCTAGVEKKNRELAAHRMELTMIRNNLLENQQELKRSGEEKIKTEGRIVGLQRDLEVSNQELNRLRESYEKAQTRLREGEEEIRDLAEARENLKKKFIEQELRRATEKEQLAEADRTIRRLRQELEHGSEQYRESQKTIEELSRTNRRLVRLIPTLIHNSGKGEKSGSGEERSGDRKDGSTAKGETSRPDETPAARQRESEKDAGR